MEMENDSTMLRTQRGVLSNLPRSEIRAKLVCVRLILLVRCTLSVPCTGCTACARVCPTEAAVGEKKQPHKIYQEKCIKCGACLDACKFDAVIVE